MTSKLLRWTMVLLPLLTFAQQRTLHDAILQKKKSHATIPFFSNTKKVNSIEGCLDAQNGLFPETVYVPYCTGQPETITGIGWTGEYSVVALSQDVTYKFSVSDPTRFITIGNEAGDVILASGTGTVEYTPAISEKIRFYLHVSDNCDTDEQFYSRNVQCGTIPQEPEYGCSQNYIGLPEEATSTNSFYDSTIANDFFVPKNVQAFKINSVKLLTLPMAETGEDIDTFSLQILEDDGNRKPGTTVLKSFENMTPSKIELHPRRFLDYELFDVTLDLGGFELPVNPDKDTRYWVAVTSKTKSENFSLYWVEYRLPSTWKTAPAYVKDQSTDGAWIAVQDDEQENNYDGIWSLDVDCNLLGITDVKSSNVSYYPNPVIDYLHINSKVDIQTVEVFSVTGEKVKSTSKLKNHKLKMSELTSGMYIVRITTTDGKITSTKVLKK